MLPETQKFQACCSSNFEFRCLTFVTYSQMSLLSLPSETLAVKIEASATYRWHSKRKLHVGERQRKFIALSLSFRERERATRESKREREKERERESIDKGRVQ